MTLYGKLKVAISKVNGNIMLIHDDRGYDEYYCKVGDHRVYEDEYVEKKQSCWKCLHKGDI